jgi:hypothetical protein
MPRRRTHHLPRLLLGGLVPCCLGPVLAAHAQQGPPSDPMYHLFGLDTLADDDWSRHFTLGAIAGFNLHARFSMAGNFNISGNNPAAGVYDDGYVETDATGNAGGYTGNWGYNNASQYNAANNTLTMHSASSYSAQENARANDPVAAGFQLTYGDTDFTWGHAKVGWELGFGLLPIEITDHSPMSVKLNESTYVFNTGGNVIPGAPYSGSFSGTGEPLLGTNYTKSASSAESGTLTGTRTLDTTLYTLRLGPSIYWDLNQEMGLFLSAGPAVGVAQNTLQYNEHINYGVASSVDSGSVSSTALVYGGYASGRLTFHVPEKADLFIGAEYMPLTRADVSGNNRRARLDLSGEIYVTAGVNWSF